MARPEPPRFSPGRLITALLVAGCVWFVLRDVASFIPVLQARLMANQVAPGVKALASGDTAAARAIFDREIRKSPSDLTVYSAIAAACGQSSHYDLEAEYLEKAIAACRSAPNQERAQVYVALSGAYQHAEKVRPQRQAIGAARAAAELDPESPLCLNAYGYVLADNGEQLPEALNKISYALQLIKKLPDGPDTQLLSAEVEDSYGWALYKQHNYDGAISALNQAIADLPLDAMSDKAAKGEALAELYYHLGTAYRGKKAYDLSQAALRTALSYAPAHADARAEMDALTRDQAAGHTASPPSAIRPGPGAPTVSRTGPTGTAPTSTNPTGTGPTGTAPTTRPGADPRPDTTRPASQTRGAQP